jgi:hypothetical protein
MSERAFLPEPVPMMTPEQARDTARSLKATADQLTTLGDVGFARVVLQQSQWYLAYAVTLSQTKREEG